jgi:hypothetical protein
MKISKEAVVVSVIRDPKRGDKTMIGTDGSGDPWTHLALLIEGVGTLAGALRNAGANECEGRSLDQYILEYVKTVLGDYKNTMRVLGPNGEAMQ